MNTLLSFKRNKHAIIWRVGINKKTKPSQTAIHTPLWVWPSPHTETLITHPHHLLLTSAAIPFNYNLRETTCAVSPLMSLLSVTLLLFVFWWASCSRFHQLNLDKSCIEVGHTQIAGLAGSKAEHSGQKAVLPLCGTGGTRGLKFKPNMSFGYKWFQCAVGEKGVFTSRLW